MTELSSVLGRWTVRACVQCDVCTAVSDSAPQGRRELKRLLWMYFIEKAQSAQTNPFTLNGRGCFPHFLLGIPLFVAASRIFCFIFSGECLEYSNVLVSWDVFTAFLTALEFYSPSTLAHTPPGNNQQKAEDHLEIKYRTHISWTNRHLPPGISSLPGDWSDLLLGTFCSPIIFPFSSHRICFQQC